MTGAKETSQRWRYIILLLDSLIGFGAGFCISMPAGLQREIVESPEPLLTGNSTSSSGYSCRYCLGLGEVRYNLLYSILRWTAAIMSLPIGIIIDRLGNTRSAILVSTLTFLGSVLFAVSSSLYFPITTALYVVIACGQVLISFGESGMRNVQERIVQHWLYDQSFIAVAFLITVRQIGGIGSYLLLANVAKYIGFVFSVWIGPTFCCVGVMCALLLGYLLRSDHFQCYPFEGKQRQTLSLKQLGKVPKRLWFYAVIISMTSGVILAICYNQPIYLELKDGYSHVTSEYITSACIAPSLLGPLFAYIMKKFDCIGLTAVGAITTVVPTLVLMAYCPSIHPFILTLCFGTVSAMLQVIFSQLTIILSPADCFGTVAGAMYAIKNIMISSILLASGCVLGNHEPNDAEGQLQAYGDFFIMLIGVIVTASVVGVGVNLYDLKTDCVCNSRFKEHMEPNEEKLALMVSTKKK